MGIDLIASTVAGTQKGLRWEADVINGQTWDWFGRQGRVWVLI